MTDEETKMDFILKGSFFHANHQRSSFYHQFFQSLTETNQRDTKAA